MQIKKYTQQQANFVKAGATLCVECQMGFYGDKSCGCSGIVKFPLNSPSGCFCVKKSEDK